MAQPRLRLGTGHLLTGRIVNVSIPWKFFVVLRRTTQRMETLFNGPRSVMDAGFPRQIISNCCILRTWACCAVTVLFIFYWGAPYSLQASSKF